MRQPTNAWENFMASVRGQVQAVHYAADAGGGRWVTIGGTKGADGKRHDAIKPEAPELSHRQALHAERKKARATWATEARKAGVKSAHLHQLAADIQAHDKAFVDERVSMLREARQALSEWGGKHRAITLGRLEQGDIPHMDEVAEDLAKRHPHAFHERGHLSDQLHDMLTAGNPDRISEDDAYDQALTHLAWPSARTVSTLSVAAAGGQEKWANKLGQAR